jgi:hypothetical protein
MVKIVRKKEKICTCLVDDELNVEVSGDENNEVTKFEVNNNVITNSTSIKL